MKKLVIAVICACGLIVAPIQAQTTNSPPPATSVIQDAGASILGYIATNGVLHAGIGWSKDDGTGPLVAQSLAFIDVKKGSATNGWVVTSGPAHSDIFFKSTTRDQIGWILDVDHTSIPNVVLFRRLEGFAYAGTDSGDAFNGKFGMRQFAAGGGFAFAF